MIPNSSLKKSPTTTHDNNHIQNQSLNLNQSIPVFLVWTIMRTWTEISKSFLQATGVEMKSWSKPSTTLTHSLNLHSIAKDDDDYYHCNSSPRSIMSAIHSFMLMLMLMQNALMERPPESFLELPNFQSSLKKKLHWQQERECRTNNCRIITCRPKPHHDRHCKLGISHPLISIIKR